MTQRQEPIHNVQQQQDERESTWLFLNSVGRQAERDEDLSQEESTALMRYDTAAGHDIVV